MTRNTQVYRIAQRLTGKLLVGGNFLNVNETPEYRLGLINSDGSADTNFIGTVGGNYPNSLDIGPYDIQLQADGKIVLGGLFQYSHTQYNGYIARLNSDGSLDPTFNSAFSGARGFDYIVNSIVIQPDGKIICGGQFTSYNGVPRKYLARLNPDGSLDESFNNGAGPNGPLSKVLVLANNRLIIARGFSSFDGVPQGNISRLIETSP
jgi:uncharacterized delta-60 repeat protein